MLFKIFHCGKNLKKLTEILARPKYITVLILMIFGTCISIASVSFNFFTNDIRVFFVLLLLSKWLLLCTLQTSMADAEKETRAVR